jgi:phage gpG-like protein
MAIKIQEFDKGLDKLRKGLKDLASSYRVTVGIQGPKGEKQREGGITNVELAEIHEFGAPSAGIPQRSFLRSTADEGMSKWKKRLGEEMGKVVTDGADVRRALTVVGEEFRAAVIDRINAHIPPPLGQATIDRKGSDTPLIDTGELVRSITVHVGKA